ncbi:MAG: molybdopterin-guanine dinucleotide biosynthesis protein B [Coriobacteriales bacterium]|nr:molybdopterin-guanine dinucleotide biosynthesis protein B [Coriobacteriales bacterium]
MDQSASADTTPAFAFIGHSNSGKTTLVVKVIAELAARGYRVGSIKHHGHRGFDIDIPGKDSWRHTQAGSVHTVIASPDKVASIRQTSVPAELPELIATMTDVDIIVVEGFKHAGLRALALYRSGNEKDLERAAHPELLESESALGAVTDIERVATRADELGKASFPFDDCAGICDFIESSCGLIRPGTESI